MFRDLPVLVTGGASFIGARLVNALVERGAVVRVADDLSVGRRESLLAHLETGRVELLVGDLRDSRLARAAVEGIDLVFHLAADHGGRGYVDTHQAGPASNLILDGNVFRAAADAGASKIVFASSGCVYPNHLQRDTGVERYLREEDVGPPYDPDNLYGWAKLTGELHLRALQQERGVGAVSCRYFTVYGPGATPSHALIAFIARACSRQDPFEVWGDGTQVRNWTYIDDIVRGTLLAAERIDDGSAVNLGTSERIRVSDAVSAVLAAFDFAPAIRYRREMPTGPLNRVADNGRALELLGWRPEVPFADGLARTIEWYRRSHSPERASQDLERWALERRV